ncbi:MAG: SHOCT domain-containing protein [Bacillota bacterium]|nr:SHOCT domain-containing protein [Bacillota bacterium]MDW7678690.1 SHOCT domain-containing protein [Bacillota bacterium]
MMFGRGYGNWSPCGWFGSRYFFGGWGMVIAAVLLIAAVAVVIYLLKRNHGHQTGNDALQALQQRYVMGEITEEEYVQKKKMLQG